MAFKVFISYSTKDLPTVNYIRNILEHSSVEVFVAEYSLLPGQSLSEEINNAIKSCNLFILLWSRNAHESKWVPQEIDIATSSLKKILPVALEPNLSLPGLISDKKYLDLYQNPENALEWLRNNVFHQAEEQQKNDGLVWLGIGATVLWLITRK